MKGYVIKHKSQTEDQSGFFCAQDKTRTCTPLRAPAPQAGVSTNFTTWAVIDASAQNRTRTCTSLLTLVPETSASTNSATWAGGDTDDTWHRPPGAPRTGSTSRCPGGPSSAAPQARTSIPTVPVTTPGMEQAHWDADGRSLHRGGVGHT